MRTGKLNVARREMHIARANENNMRNQLRARVDKLRAENAELTEQLAAAEKDAAVGRVVFNFIDRMNDVSPECGDSAERILSEFVTAVYPVIDSSIAASREGKS